MCGRTLLLPVELRRVNHTASTNGGILTRRIFPKPYNATSMVNNATPMSKPSQVDQIAERVERLLLRYAELQRTNALLTQQVDLLTGERDSLKSRLSAARARVDALLERLPENTQAKEAP
jgi:ABC-type phosphate transport system auxiliary subunit